MQGADRASFIPHAKIEKLILKSDIAYTFIRPSYFMQNLTTTLRQDIREKNKIFLPAGEAHFLWVDVDDIGKAIARVLEEPEKHLNRIYTITERSSSILGRWQPCFLPWWEEPSTTVPQTSCGFSSERKKRVFLPPLSW